MLEITSSRHNPLIDPALQVWGWEIPVYLFAGGVVAGMMVLGGIAMVRIARGDDPRAFHSVQAPLLAFVLINLGMGALFLDLAHKLAVWRVYTTFQPTSPMSWGSWLLVAVYAVLLASAVVRLPESWPWLGRRVPVLQDWSTALLTRPGRLRALGWVNVVLGIGLGIYTGILLDTMVARPLWNSAILGPLFLVSGLSAGAATVHLAGMLRDPRTPPPGMFRGALAATLGQPLGYAFPPRRTSEALVRSDIAFLAIELVLGGLLLVNLYTSSASHAAAAALVASGPYSGVFWGVVVIGGVVGPLALQSLELAHRIPHTAVPALLVLAGGFALRWVLVHAGQASQIVQIAGP